MRRAIRALAHMIRRVRHAVSVRVRARLARLAPSEIAVSGLIGYRWDRYLLVALASSFRVEADRELQPLLEELLGWRQWLTRVCTIPRSGRINSPVVVTQDPCSSTGRQRVLIAIDDFDEPPPGTLVMPYFCHPRIYEQRLHRRFPALRLLTKQQRMSFAGTAVSAAYPPLRGFGDLLSRPQVIDAARAALRGRTAVLRSADDLRHHVLGSTDLLLVLNECVEDDLSKQVLSLPLYLELVARSWCFLAPPGVTMPFSHNLIEAMAVGTIPILNYAHLLRPPLEDGRTCFSFSSPEELADVLGRVARAEEGYLAQVRQEVLAYYEDVLSPTSFGAELKRALRGGTDVRVLVNAEGESVRARLQHATSQRRSSMYSSERAYRASGTGGPHSSSGTA